MRDLQDIEARLKENKDLLRERFKVKEIGIFGSFVRGEQKETSDLDILVDFEGRRAMARMRAERPQGACKWIGGAAGWRR